MADGHDWIVQNIALNIFSYAVVLTAIWAWKNREKLAERFGRSPKPSIVPLDALSLTVKTAQASIKAGSTVTVRGNVEDATPPLATRLLDEGLELLSVLPRHL